MNRFVILFPQDETTAFLEPIPKFLFEIFGDNQLLLKRIGFSHEEHDECRTFINELEDDACIFFLGHGKSDGLLGAYSESFSREVLIAKNQLGILKKKKLFCLACKSTHFLNKQNIHSIGFDNLVTEMREIYQAQNIPHNGLAYANINESDIEKFRQILVDIVKFSLAEYIWNQQTLKELFLSLKLRFNKHIFTLINENEPSSVNPVANLLYESKRGMRLFF